MFLLQLVLFALTIRGGSGADPVWAMPTMADTASVDENVAVSTPVYTLDATDADIGDTLTYSIDSQVPNMPTFLLDGTVLQAPAGLDAEGTASFDFTFNVTDGMVMVTSNMVTVTVNDLSDVDPVFSAASYSGSIKDGASNGDTVTTVNATPDVMGATITYTLTMGNSPVTFAIGSISGEITVSDETMVDSGTTSSYPLEVTASDGTRSNTVIVTVTVSANNLPIWSTPSVGQSEAVDENIAAGMPVIQLAAMDADMGDTITYSVVSQNPSTPMFSLTMGGELQTPAGLDAETHASYLLTFGASDGVGLVNSPVLTVTITDLADENPVFNPASYSFNIMDTVANGDTVGTVMATADLSGGTITYSITGGNSPVVFMIGSGTGEITVSDATNINLGDTFMLVVTADDGTLTNTVNVDVTVSANNLPTWTTPIAGQTEAVDENVVASMPVIQLAATDADGNTITYSVVSQSPSTPMFSLTMGGELQTPAGLDAETHASYLLTFGASDGVGTVNSPVLTVTITDVADVIPVFSQASYTFTIMDDVATGDTVGTVSATADLSGDSITYTITGGNSSVIFAIGSGTGVITVNDNTNINSGDTFTLVVTADDGTLTNTVNVDVTVSAAGNDAKSIEVSISLLLGISFIWYLLRILGRDVTV